MRPFDLILFDLGSTLIYFDGDWETIITQADQALLRSLESAGLRLDGQAFIAEFRDRMENYLAERESEFIERTAAYLLRTTLGDFGYPELRDGVVREALREMFAVSQAHWHPETDLLPTLHTLRAQGYRLGLISNASDDDDVQALIDKACIRSYFDYIVSSAAAGIRKPNPRIFTMALAALGVQPAQAAMVGDTLGADILGAKNAGIFAIWITRRADTPANREHAKTIQPDAVIATLAELPSLLQRLSATRS